MRNIGYICACLVAVFSRAAIADAVASDEYAIDKTYTAWLAATNEKDLEKWSAFLAESPYFFPADAPPLGSRKAILAYYERLFSDPAFSLSCEQLEVQVSRSGDMAWSRGVCQGTFTLPGGGEGHGSSQWLKVWTKRPDGAWKCRINSWKSAT